MSNKLDSIFRMYKCECGKNVIPHPGWMYKIKSKYYCSYTCYHKAGGDGGKKNNNK